MNLILASANPDKAAEMTAILVGELGARAVVLPRPPEVPEVPEVGETLEENARLKAAAVSEATGEATIADDTGLEVEALAGAPGVRSARYAGEGASYADNVAKLLAELDGAGADAPELRAARFRTVAIAHLGGGREVMAEGVVEGWIAPAPRGEHGFGYDPVFVPAEGDGRTFAEMEPEEKHAISHRGRALRALAAALVPELASDL